MARVVNLNPGGVPQLPKVLDAQQLLAELLLSGRGRTPNTLGGGIADFGNKITGAFLARQAQEVRLAENKARADKQADLVRSIFGEKETILEARPADDLTGEVTERETIAPGADRTSTGELIGPRQNADINLIRENFEFAPNPNDREPRSPLVTPRDPLRGINPAANANLRNDPQGLAQALIGAGGLGPTQFGGASQVRGLTDISLEKGPPQPQLDLTQQFPVPEITADQEITQDNLSLLGQLLLGGIESERNRGGLPFSTIINPALKQQQDRRALEREQKKFDRGNLAKKEAATLADTRKVKAAALKAENAILLKKTPSPTDSNRTINTRFKAELFNAGVTDENGKIIDSTKLQGVLDKFKKEAKVKADRPGVYKLPKTKSNPTGAGTISHAQLFREYKQENSIKDPLEILVLTQIDPKAAGVAQRKSDAAMPFAQWAKRKRGIDVLRGFIPEPDAVPEDNGIARPQTQEEYDALPSGAQFIDDEGIVKVKP